MIDIGFYMRLKEFKNILPEIPPGQRDEICVWLDKQRSSTPVVFNIETTNACNMTCPFCPRTTLMTRPVKTMSRDVFADIAAQLVPHPPELWNEWAQFANEVYGVPPNEQSENAFFLYILPKVLVLHGYGDPLLDPHIPDYVGILTGRDIPTYFSCNPANINLGKTANVFENGLTYIKYSIDSLSASVRGKDAFKQDYPQIMAVLDMKAKHNYKTQVIITMINLGRDEYESLKDAFAGTDVYIYQKSLDQAWMVGGDKPLSIHWSEFCQMPWSSMTINSSGLSVACQEDFNGEIVLGDAKTQSPSDIWNGDAYTAFRKSHFYKTPGKCWENCDMKVIGKWLS